MSKKSLQDILSSLNELSFDERKEVTALIQFLNQEFDRNTNTEEDLFYDAICKILRRELKIKMPASSSFMKATPTYKKLKEARLFLIEYFKELLNKEVLTRNELGQGYFIYAEMMFKYQKRINKHEYKFPITFKTILYSYMNFPSIVENEYPGYAATGLGHIIFNPKIFDKNIKGEVEKEDPVVEVILKDTRDRTYSEEDPYCDT